MTSEAQSALRRIIEDNSATTRFCIICNYITKYPIPYFENFLYLLSGLLNLFLQDVLNSDLSLFQKKLKLTDLNISAKKKALSMKKTYNFPLDFVSLISHQALFNLVQITEGDMRRSVNLLQSIGLLFDREISEEGVTEISGVSFLLVQ